MPWIHQQNSHSGESWTHNRDDYSLGAALSHGRGAESNVEAITCADVLVESGMRSLRHGERFTSQKSLIRLQVHTFDKSGTCQFKIPL